MIILKTNRNKVLDFSLSKNNIRQVDIDSLKNFDIDNLCSSKFMKLFNYLSVCIWTVISKETILKYEHECEKIFNNLNLLSISSNKNKAKNIFECTY